MGVSFLMFGCFFFIVGLLFCFVFASCWWCFGIGSDSWILSPWCWVICFGVLVVCFRICGLVVWLVCALGWCRGFVCVFYMRVLFRWFAVFLPVLVGFCFAFV